MRVATAPETNLSTREKIAVGLSAAILLASALYWLVQIKDVIATLKMAYGG
jgi:hypothetical protein